MLIMMIIILIVIKLIVIVIIGNIITIIIIIIAKSFILFSHLTRTPIHLLRKKEIALKVYIDQK